MTTKAYYNIEIKSSFEGTPDGGLMVHNVPLMAEGVWTSMQGIVTNFTAEVLQRCANVWNDTGIWLRHPGGSPRDAHDKVGAVKNPHYDPSLRAVVGDLYLHQKTENSRSAGQLVQLSKQDGGIKDVSAETMLTLGKDGTVQGIVFTGLALVEDGACETCRIPAFSAEGEKDMTDDMKKDEPTEDTVTEPVDAEDGSTDTKDIPETAEPAIIKALTEALETVVPGITEIVENIIASNGDEVTKAKGFGRLEQALMACGGGSKKSYSKPNAEFEAYKKETDTKIAQLQASFAKIPAGKVETTTNIHKQDVEQSTESGTQMKKSDVSIGNIRRGF